MIVIIATVSTMPPATRQSTRKVRLGEGVEVEQDALAALGPFRPSSTHCAGRGGQELFAMYLQVHVMVAYLSNFTWLWLRCSFRRLCHHQTPFTFEGVAPSGPPLWSFSLALGMPCCLAEWPGAADCCAGWCSFAACQHMAVAQMFAADALTRTCHHESPPRARCNKGGGPRAISLRWCRLPACVGLQVHQRTGACALGAVLLPLAA